MKEVFLNKINNEEYISNLLFINIKEQFPNIIPPSFDINTYNNKILNREYIKYKDYFHNMYKGIDDNIKLDEEQIKAILADEDFSLIIAGAGTGKTTTMVSKVKYLVDIKKVNPQDIVVMSFTRKATEELEKRLLIDFEIPVNVTTFHSLGLMHIREIFNNKKCYVVDSNIENEIFFEYFSKNIFPYKDKVKEIIDIFSPNLISKSWVFGNFFKENFEKHRTFDEYFLNYKKYKISKQDDLKKTVETIIEQDLNKEDIYTIKRELVKSKGEAIIANYLFCNNIDYKYEKIYTKLMGNRQVYKPDFTLNLNGEEIYIEYFGLSTYTKDTLNRYQKIKKIKEDYHQKHKTKFIKLDYMKEQDLIKTLELELKKYGFKLKPKTYEEIYDAILSNNPIRELFPFKDFLYGLINKIKSNSKRNEYREIISNYLTNTYGDEKYLKLRQFYYIDDFYIFYQEYLYRKEDYGFDFNDMIYYANKYINKVNNKELSFKYLIIDEYQDISQERYEFTRNIATKDNSKIVAVGDDWQSIYSFSGSKIDYIYKFEEYFKGAKLFKITNTYRNSQSLIDCSGTFIMRNKDQIKKDLTSNKNIFNPIRFIMFDEFEEYDVLKKLILKIHNENKEHKIMILARNNKMIDDCFNDPMLRDEVGTKIEFVGYEDIDIDGMTIHKSKGLTSDEVILIGLNQNFPSNNYDTFWIERLFRYNIPKESIEYAEERRLFYVALTRTKNYVYLLVNKNPKLRSIFINEIYNIIKNNKELY